MFETNKAKISSLTPFVLSKIFNFIINKGGFYSYTYSYIFEWTSTFQIEETFHLFILQYWNKGRFQQINKFQTPEIIIDKLWIWILNEGNVNARFKLRKSEINFVLYWRHWLCWTPIIIGDKTMVKKLTSRLYLRR